MKEADIKKLTKEVEDFFKVAFFVDGEVKIVQPEGFKIDSVLMLNDSKRGIFYIARVLPNH